LVGFPFTYDWQFVAKFHGAAATKSGTVIDAGVDKPNPRDENAVVGQEIM
jgi:hypothetical protein